jgi:hypothetical protein
MIQDIITYTLIATASGYTLYNIFRMVIPVKKTNASYCAGCAGCNITKKL